MKYRRRPGRAGRAIRWRRRVVEAEHFNAGASADADPYAQLRRALSLHLHQVADLVELGRHEGARESFCFAMAISSELDIRSARGTARARPLEPRHPSA
jgi:hypothetical protein